MFFISSEAKEKISMYLDNNDDLIATLYWGSCINKKEENAWQIGFHNKEKVKNIHIINIDGISFCIDVNPNAYESIEGKTLSYKDNKFILK